MPLGRAGLVVLWAPARAFDLVLISGAEVSLVRQRFAVRGEGVADLGVLAPFALAAARLRIP